MLGHVLDDDDARRIGGQHLEHCAQRLGAAGRGADADHHLGRAAHRPPAGRRQHRVGGQLGLRFERADRRAAPLHPRTGGALHHLADHVARLVEMVGHPHARLEDDVDRPRLERLHERLGALLGERGAHHHRHRALAHQLAQEGDAVHPRHLDVEGDDVGHLALDAAGGGEGIGGGGDHLDAGVLLEDRLHRLAHGGAVIDNQHAGLVGAHGSISSGRQCRRPVPGSGGNR